MHMLVKQHVRVFICHDHIDIIKRIIFQWRPLLFSIIDRLHLPALSPPIKCSSPCPIISSLSGPMQALLPLLLSRKVTSSLSCKRSVISDILKSSIQSGYKVFCWKRGFIDNDKPYSRSKAYISLYLDRCSKNRLRLIFVLNGCGCWCGGGGGGWPSLHELNFHIAVGALGHFLHRRNIFRALDDNLCMYEWMTSVSQSRRVGEKLRSATQH